ncbi:MAG: hypothetical protein IPH42_20645 [Bacteroidetes bacterium]|nr:hypothetical protein [Bacteroidota bacterium]
MKIYSDILNELVEHHFYNRYLGKDEQKIFNKYASNNPDTAKISREVIQLQNNLFNDTTRFCIIYLDTVYRPDFNQWTYYQNDTGQYAREFKDLINTFTIDGLSVIDSLNSMQLSFEAKRLSTLHFESFITTKLQQSKGKMCNWYRKFFKSVS